MSLTNNSNSFTNNRSSIFETFHTPNFGDDEFNVSTSTTSAETMRTYSHILQPSRMHNSNVTAGSVADDGRGNAGDVQFAESPEPEEQDVEMMATLWMSCSPGRDSPVEEEEVEGEEDDEEEEVSEDDLVPLSQFQTKKNRKASHMKKATKEKPKKKRDPNAPKKSMSAYSLFFKDTQASIKTQNPSATFGEISRIVASMWDGLQTHEKDKYNSQAEKEKQAYQKALAEYQSSLTKGGNKPASKTKSSKSAKKLAPEQQDRDPDFIGDGEEERDEESARHSKSSSRHKTTRIESESEATDSSSEESAEDEPVAVTKCARTNCNKATICDPRWDADFCSEQCVVLHCRDVFSAWVASRQSSSKVE